MINCASGPSCRGFVIGAFIVILVYGTAAWLLFLAWNVMSTHHIGYWLALVALLILGTLAGAGVAWLETRKARRIQ